MLTRRHNVFSLFSDKKNYDLCLAICVIGSVIEPSGQIETECLCTSQNRTYFFTVDAVGSTGKMVFQYGTVKGIVYGCWRCAGSHKLQ